MTRQLPEGFEDLERFVPAWVHGSEKARNAYRVEQSQADLQAFYDAMMPRLPAIAAHLDTFPLEAMPAAQGALLELALMTMEVAPAIEYYDQPDVPDSVEYGKFDILSTPPRYRVVGR